MIGMDKDPEHWEERVRASDYLSVSEIDGCPVVVFVSVISNGYRIQVRHAKRI